ncbi:MAG: pseudouridine synthase [Bradyrhizobiaceae bacterium]|nr:pseudouridine synthase [Bradyrhizobiaceae bacterium]
MSLNTHNFGAGSTDAGALQSPLPPMLTMRIAMQQPRNRTRKTTSKPRTSAPRSDERRPAPRSDERRPAPRSDERRSAPRSDGRRSTPRSDERRSTPRSDERRSAPRSDERRSAPRSDERRSAPRSDERRSAPRSDERRSTPRSDERRSAPRSDERRSAPRSDERRSAPRSDERRSTPRSDERRSAPRSDERSSPKRRWQSDASYGASNDKRRAASSSTSRSKGQGGRATRSDSRSFDLVKQRRNARNTQELPQEARLNKAIADAGVASRRAADELIASGKVTINGKVCLELGRKIGPTDFVSVNGEPITRYKHLTYVLLNKPKDVISTSSDELDRKTVFDIVRLKTRLFTVGRLDRNTTGVLLVTNDGELCNRLMHPRYGIVRVYNATLNMPMEAKHASQIAKGVELEDGPTQPCEVFIDPRDPHKVSVQIKEGRNREVRRLFEHFGYDVRKLDRKQYAFLSTRGLARGEYRHLTREEVSELKKLVGLDKSSSTSSSRRKKA